MSAEEQVEVLREEAQRQYSQSVEDLQDALGIQNRTIAVQKLTQNQLLQLESEYKLNSLQAIWGITCELLISFFMYNELKYFYVHVHSWLNTALQIYELFSVHDGPSVSCTIGITPSPPHTTHPPPTHTHTHTHTPHTPSTHTHTHTHTHTTHPPLTQTWCVLEPLCSWSRRRSVRTLVE